MAENKGFFVVGIGASAGGLEATQAFFKHITAGSQAAFVVVQHLSPDFKSLMDELLVKYTDLPIIKIEAPTPVEPGCIYLMSSRQNVVIKNNVLQPVAHRKEDKINLPIDLFFHSLGRDQDSCSMGIILSGTGTDGSRGIKTIHECGGIVMVQDPDDAKLDGMPRAAQLSKVVDYTLPVHRISAEVNRIVDGQNAPLLLEHSRALPTSEEDYLQEIMGLVYQETKIDFSLYRPETILRRLTKRLFVVRVQRMKDYYEYVQTHPDEPRTLAREFLIGVSQFFRDSSVWEQVTERVIPPIINQKKDHDTIRVWVAACSTGEEAYTLGMLFNEAIRKAKRPLTLKVFATDVNPDAIASSGNGLYAENTASAVSASLLSRYFDPTSEGYRIKKEFREQFVFATHNFLSDPPFIKMDLVSCRNALIYIQSTVQQKVLENFRFSLKQEGYLLLGKSEGLGLMKPAFETVASRHKVFKISPHYQPPVRHIVPGVPLVTPRRPSPTPASSTPSALSYAVTDIYPELLAEQYAPDGVFVNASLDVLYIHGRADRYLKLPRRQARLNLDTMLNAEQVTQLRTGVRQVLEQDTSLVYERVAFQKGERVDITFTVLHPSPADDPLVLIAFGDPQAGSSEAGAVEKMAPNTLMQERTRQLENELRSKDQELQSLREQLETSNEELQASNEELLSSNEELQSSNEELQSMNQELYTVNTELQEKVEELISTNNDIANLLNSTQIATLFLDQELRIRMFTPAIGEIIRIAGSDVGRAIDHFSVNLQDTSLIEDAQWVLKHGDPLEKEVSTRDKKRLLLRIFPYQNSDGTTDGLVITLVNLTEIKKARQAVQDAKNYAESIVESVKDPLIVLNQALEVVSANPAFYQTFSTNPEETVDHRIYELGDGQWNVAPLRSLLEEVIPDNAIVNDYVITQTFPALGKRVMQLDAVRVLQASDRPGLILLSIRDITEKERAQEQIRVTAERLAMVLQSSKTGIWEWDLAQNTVEANDRWHTIFGIDDPGAVAIERVMERVHPEDRPRIDRAIKQSMDNGRFYNEDFRVVRDTGEVIFINGQGSVIRDEAGAPIKMLGTNVDITDKKQREEQLRLSEERFTMAVSGTSDGVYDYFNVETGESWWSPRLYELLGLAPGEVRANANYFRQRVYPKDQGLTQKAIREYINTGRPFDIEFRVKHKTLGYRWFRSRANIVLNDQGEVVRMVGAFADIHQRKLSELSLQQVNRKLRVANEYLDNFVFMAAHDLRSPVANLKSLTTLWHSGYDNHELIIEKVENSVIRLDDTLSGLIQILDIQQYEHNPRSEVAFDTIYRELVAEMEPLIRSAEVSLRTDFTAPSICYIEPFLESVMRNLLSNALQYRSPHRASEITLSTRRDNGFVLLQVQDNGVGIDLKRSRDKLFKAFERLTREGEGRGIGMHLVKNMVEKNEGFIEVESEVDQGTTFKIYLKPY